MNTYTNVIKLKKITIIIIAVFFILSGNVMAGWCQGKPFPEQKSFFVFETSWKTRMTGSTINPYKAGFIIATESGYMKNISPKKSVGGTLYFSADDDGSNFGLKFRYRYWLSKSLSLDLSPGLILSAHSNKMQIKTPSFMASATFGVKDLIAIDLHFQAIRYNWTDRNYDYLTQTNAPINKSGTESNLYFGVRFGSYVAVVSVVALTVLAASYANSMSGGSYYY